MHLSAEECPHCGLTLEHLDHVYEGFSRVVRRPHDVAGVLRVKERAKVAKLIAKAEKAFPQLYVSVATVSLRDDQQIRSYGYWLMNRGEFEERRAGSRVDGCVLLVLDVDRKEACICFGYLMDQHMKEVEAFSALADAHPHLLEGRYVRALDVMLCGVKKYVKRLCRRAKREAKKAR